MDEIKWEEPPEQALFVGSGHSGGKYREFAIAIREKPNEWAVLPSDNKSENGARSTAQNIRLGKVKGFTPKGAYETAVHATKIWVRYVGVSEPVSSTEREPADDSVAVRAWARTNGFNVSDRGRIPEAITQAYRNRNGR